MVELTCPAWSIVGCARGGGPPWAQSHIEEDGSIEAPAADCRLDKAIRMPIQGFRDACRLSPDI